MVTKRKKPYIVRFIIMFFRLLVEKLTDSKNKKRICVEDKTNRPKVKSTYIPEGYVDNTKKETKFFRRESKSTTYIPESYSGTKGGFDNWTKEFSISERIKHRYYEEIRSTTNYHPDSFSWPNTLCQGKLAGI